MKTIIITGGSDGLGKAIAARLSATHKVYILSRNEELLRAAAQELSCKYIVCDVRNYDQVARAVEQVGQVDYLINNAGLWLQGPLDETDPERMRETLETNTLGTMYCTRAVMPVMKQQKSGQIINVISQGGLNARNGWPVYTASKWALTGFTKAMQQELEPFGIRVAGFYPGTIKTELFAKAGAPKDLTGALEADDVAKTVEFMLAASGSMAFTDVGMKPFRP